MQISSSPLQGQRLAPTTPQPITVPRMDPNALAIQDVMDWKTLERNPCKEQPESSALGAQFELEEFAPICPNGHPDGYEQSRRERQPEAELAYRGKPIAILSGPLAPEY